MQAVATTAGTPTLVRIRVHPVDAAMPSDARKQNEIRDRLAYVYLAGHLPSHSRTPTVDLLRRMTSYVRTGQAQTVARCPASFVVHPRAVTHLGLAEHPMVVKVLAHIHTGGRVIPPSALEATARRPYGRVLIERADRGRVTVQVNGSELEGREVV